MTTERNIIIHAGQTFELSLDYAGTAGRGQRMHIRASDAAADVIAILSHNGDANARVIYNDSTQKIDITIGASVSGAWLVGANRVEWKYDIEDYDLSDDDDIDIPYRGSSIVYGNRTRPEDVTPSAALPSGDGRYVRFDGVQGLTDAQKLQARENIGAGTGGGGGSGDVVGPTSATDDRIAAFDGTTGKLIKQGTVTATAVASHLSSTSNPHSVTAAQVGADPAGTAASAVSTHAGAADPHGDRAYADGLAANYATAAQGALADSAVQDIAAETHAAAEKTTLADDDELGLIDSAASWVLKRLKWSSIKTALGSLGLTGFAAAESTSAPNATVPVASLSANNAATNVDAALAPKGAGAVLADVPDSAAAGGNKRGANAVDWQTSRSAASQVASGATSTIVGGAGNTASGLSSVAGGDSNTASAAYGVALGWANTASGGSGSSVAIGRGNTSSGNASVGLGFFNIASGSASIACGIGNTASGANSWVPGGANATTRGLISAYAWASVQRSALGDNQHYGQVTGATTTDAATTTVLTADRAAVSTTNVAVMPNNSAMSGTWLIHARDSSGNAATWIKAFRATRGANAASTAIAFSADVITANIDAALSTVTVTIAADTTRGGPVVQVTGVAATTIDWLCEPFSLQTVR